MPTWLNDAVFYEVYPQSFLDTNADGIGDLAGIVQKLDYIKSIGCNAVWLNPIYDSPFLDGGYDVRDHKMVASRYGSNDDLYFLFDRAHALGIRVILDLVPGHTSIDHPWFLESQKSIANPMSGRYIFTRSVWDAPDGYRWVSGTTERDGNFLVNFFSTQPALNYGFHDIVYPEWQDPPVHPNCLSAIDALMDVMRFWLAKGADGFRVDMADSLVKNDDEKIATSKLWRTVREMLDREYPEAVLISEWSNPQQAVNMAGFHVDFYLDHWHNGYHSLVRKRDSGENTCYVSKEGKGDITLFTSDFIPKYEATKHNGYIGFITCNHDTPRLTRHLDHREIELAYALIFTMPGVPFLYYGDEIGMRYIEGLTSKEGGYNRTGSRTPMQWDKRKNLGFSKADPHALYLPVDSAADPPTVQSQMDSQGSLLETVKDLLSIRHRYGDLKADGDFEVIHAKADDPLFAYRRGDLLLFVNPSKSETFTSLHVAASCRIGVLRPPAISSGNIVYSIGQPKIEGERLMLPPQSFCILK